ncbi:MAG: molybdopterin-dependent oxidoreductase [Acidobacteria bacterium]|nr:molybdopterin-dependent oxidoreductase [Acidobacteriota bacterium]
MAEKVHCTIDGRTVEPRRGQTILQVADELGIYIPRYCYHPGLSIAGNCRICLVSVEKAPKPQIACYTQVQEGMTVWTHNEAAQKARRGVLEFLLVNHPLDCPVCDQAGECWLQDYYMQFGLYTSRLREDKIKKAKAKVLGPAVILDAERCILCTRCVRFCNEIAGTHELEVFQMGAHEELGTYPGVELKNPYSGCVVDICPVGALTDRDFRFKARVWYLSEQKSVCPGCATGCNIRVHFNQKRTHHALGKRVMRLKPRYNPHVNDWWMCDEGRYGYRWIDEGRLLVPQKRRDGTYVDLDWDQALSDVASGLRAVMDKHGPSSVAVLPSPQQTNEALYLVRRLFAEHLGVRHVDFWIPPATQGYHDDFLIKADKNPNSAGARLLGLFPRDGSPAAEEFLLNHGPLKALYVFRHDLLGRYGEEALRPLLGNLELLVYQGTNRNATSRRADYVLPSAAYMEEHGTFVNFKGRVQRLFQCLEPLAQSLPDWKILVRLAVLLGLELGHSGQEEIFLDMAREIPALDGLDYAALGDQGVESDFSGIPLWPKTVNRQRSNVSREQPAHLPRVTNDE